MALLDWGFPFQSIESGLFSGMCCVGMLFLFFGEMFFNEVDSLFASYLLYKLLFDYFFKVSWAVTFDLCVAFIS